MKRASRAATSPRGRAGRTSPGASPGATETIGTTAIFRRALMQVSLFRRPPMRRSFLRPPPLRPSLCRRAPKRPPLAAAGARLGERAQAPGLAQEREHSRGGLGAMAEAVLGARVELRDGAAERRQ